MNRRHVSSTILSVTTQTKDAAPAGSNLTCRNELLKSIFWVRILLPVPNLAHSPKTRYIYIVNHFCQHPFDNFAPLCRFITDPLSPFSRPPPNAISCTVQRLSFSSTTSTGHILSLRMPPACPNRNTNGLPRAKYAITSPLTSASHFFALD